MKRKRRRGWGIVVLVSSIFLTQAPSPSCAATRDTTPLTLTFSQQLAITAPSVERPEVTPVTVPKKTGGLSTATRTETKRLPLTGEEYDWSLYCLGWLTLICGGLFFTLGRYERRRTWK